MGSALRAGHRPRAGFFLEPQEASGGALAGMPFVWTEDEEIVEDEDAVEAIDEDEFERWTLLREGINILETSSAEEMPFCGLGALHPPVLAVG